MCTIILEVAFSGIMLVFFAYCFWYIGTITPPSEPGTMGSGVWPQILLVSLIVLIAINIYRAIKKSSLTEKSNLAISSITMGKLLQNKFFLGSATLLIYSYILDYLGFIVSTVFVTFTYMALLSEQRWWFKTLVSLAVTVVIYVVFSWALAINLPRGVGIFREFALWLETI